MQQNVTEHLYQSALIAQLEAQDSSWGCKFPYL